MLQTIGALTQVCVAALGDLDATVIEGQPAHPIGTTYGLSVGLGYNDDAPITITDEPIGAAVRSDSLLVVRCIGQVLGSVDADLAVLRMQASDLMTRIDAAIAADMTLGGTAAMAWIGGIQRFWPARTTEVAVWTMSFDVHIQVL